MIILNSSSVLRARLSAAVASANPSFAFYYGDDQGSLAPSSGVLNGTTNVTLVGSPSSGARVIKSGFIYNADTASVTVIIEHYDGTNARQLAKKTIPPGQELTLCDEGFVVGNGGATAPYDWIIALGDETTAITTGTAKVTIRAPRAITLTKVKASLTTASSSGNPVFDVKKNGTSIFSTTLSIDATETTSETAATPAVLSTTSIAADDVLTFDISTAGTGAAGAKITLVGTA